MLLNIIDQELIFRDFVTCRFLHIYQQFILHRALKFLTNAEKIGSINR